MWLGPGTAVAVAYRVALTSLIQIQAWELPYVTGGALQKQNRNKNKNNKKRKKKRKKKKGKEPPKMKQKKRMLHKQKKLCHIENDRCTTKGYRN